jgi:hypothetical protein
MGRQENAAKRWVEENFPHSSGPVKAALILAYGAGLDLGLAEAEEMLVSYRNEVNRLAGMTPSGHKEGTPHRSGMTPSDP